MTAVADGVRYLERPQSSGLADVVDLILDKGLVIDAFVRVSVLGLELITIDARIVIASIDTYLRFAEVVDRVMLSEPPARARLDQAAAGGGAQPVEAAASTVAGATRSGAVRESTRGWQGE